MRLTMRLGTASLAAPQLDNWSARRMRRVVPAGTHETRRARPSRLVCCRPRTMSVTPHSCRQHSAWCAIPRPALTHNTRTRAKACVCARTCVRAGERGSARRRACAGVWWHVVAWHGVCGRLGGAGVGERGRKGLSIGLCVQYLHYTATRCLPGVDSSFL